MLYRADVKHVFKEKRRKTDEEHAEKMNDSNTSSLNLILLYLRTQSIAIHAVFVAAHNEADS
jgi:hypothetical protein